VLRAVAGLVVTLRRLGYAFCLVCPLAEGCVALAALFQGAGRAISGPWAMQRGCACFICSLEKTRTISGCPLGAQHLRNSLTNELRQRPETTLPATPSHQHSVIHAKRPKIAQSGAAVGLLLREPYCFRTVRQSSEPLRCGRAGGLFIAGLADWM
jgi:hypothetical protein